MSTLSIMSNSSNSDSHTASFGALMTVAEVASYLRVSEMTVYRLIERRSLAATKIGRSWRVAEADLAEYLSDRRVSRAS